MIFFAIRPPGKVFLIFAIRPPGKDFSEKKSIKNYRLQKSTKKLENAKKHTTNMFRAKTFFRHSASRKGLFDFRHSASRKIRQANQPASPASPASPAQPAQSLPEISILELAPPQMIVPMHTPHPTIGGVGTKIQDRSGLPAEQLEK